MGFLFGRAARCIAIEMQQAAISCRDSDNEGAGSPHLVGFGQRLAHAGIHRVRGRSPHLADDLKGTETKGFQTVPPS